MSANSSTGVYQQIGDLVIVFSCVHVNRRCQDAWY